MGEERKAVIGSKANFWLYSSISGFDLTHPPTPDSPPTHPRVSIETTRARVAIDPAKSALLIIDMQNFFLSPCLGRPKDSNGMKACDKLLKFAIPACRRAGIRIIWLNWGLTMQEIEEMPPATLRAFGFSSVPHDVNFEDAYKSGTAVGDFVSENDSNKPEFGKNPRIYKGLGSQMGSVELEDGTKVDAGRLLMREQWNTELYLPLEETRQQGMKGKIEREDVWIHKNRQSGTWGAETDCTRYLDNMGIRTLLFAGVNTDQCVGGSLQDAFTKGYDCIMLADGCGTTSPSHSQECIEFNSAKVWGFTSSCEDLYRGVENMKY